jgi:hypothetical protein
VNNSSWLFLGFLARPISFIFDVFIPYKNKTLVL